MAYQNNAAPFKAQDPIKVAHMVDGLESHVKGKGGTGGFSAKKNTFTVADSNFVVDSWKMQEWDYKKPGLPTYARGLFVTKNSKGEDEIVTRGYDKFFNQTEVAKTQWRNIEDNTTGPYELSVKENGCIIFLSGLEDGTLLVCSKHSTGKRDDTDVNHAVAGERWVERHLAPLGKTKRDLALKLREMNATAVAELCDDEFEEHVLAYSPDAAGLYLHGINLNLPEFATYPSRLVGSFADQWGFKRTMFVVENDINQVKAFLGETAITGSYNGRDTEGFVIRCQGRDDPQSPFGDWFFKYKFEEPYLMYRQWRECTKAIIAGKPPKVRKHIKVTEEYLHFARKKLVENPELGKAYNQNHGIIKLRDEFLAARGQKGSDIIRQEQEAGEVDGAMVTENVVLVPVASIGCGKTTVSLALCKLFGWGQIQNDNITQKPKPQNFARAVCQGLTQHPVMVADRNNHQRRERQQIISDVARVVPDAKFVALHYVHDRSNYDQIRMATQQRVLNRGDNHQTIQAGSKGREEIVGIMEGFLHRFEPVNGERDPDDAFDEIIDLNVASSSRENLETIVARLSEKYPKLFGVMPTGEDLDRAIEEALNDYKPDIKHEIRGGNRDSKKHQKQGQQQSNGQKPAKVEYFGVSLPVSRVTSILEAVFREVDPQIANTWNQLKRSGRVQQEFHVTLMHKSHASQYPEEWETLSKMHSDEAARAGNPEPEIGKCKVHLERLVWDHRLMCFVVRLIPKSDGHPFRSVNATAHVTVGTVDPSVKPVESNNLLQNWLRLGSGPETGIMECQIKGHVELDGSVKGVVQKR